jgi:hypothetical protein
MDRTRRMRSARNKGASSRRLSPNNRAQRAPVFFAAVRAQSAAKPSADGRWSLEPACGGELFSRSTPRESSCWTACEAGLFVVWGWPFGFGAWAWAGVRGVGAAGRGWVI